jgi:hypothetical protein
MRAATGDRACQPDQPNRGSCQTIAEVNIYSRAAKIATRLAENTRRAEDGSDSEHADPLRSVHANRASGAMT